MSSSFYIRPSEVTAYDSCPRAYFFRYVLKIPTQKINWYLPYGSAVHAAIEPYLRGEFKDKEDPGAAMADVFEEAWKAEIGQYPGVDFGKKWSAESVVAMGRLLMARFPTAWTDLGITIQRGDDGRLLLEERLQAPIGNGIIVSGQPDVIGITTTLNTRVLDFKTPASETSEKFLEMSEKEKIYSMILEHNNLALGEVEIQYLEMLKRPVPKRDGKGPTIEPTKPTRCSDIDKREVIQKITWMVGDMLDGRFPRRPAMAFNTPCGMCDYVENCRTYRYDQTNAKALMRERIFYRSAAA